jgi:putative flippase GtrA
MKFGPLVSTMFGNHKVGKFLVAGVINTVFGYALYATLIYLGLSYIVALLISTILGIIFNFFSFARIAFKRNFDWYAFGKFIIAYFLIYVFNCALLIFLTQEFLLNPYIGQILCIPLSVILSWSLMNYWVYKKD